MIAQVAREDIPPIAIRPAMRKSPESAFAKRQMADFIESGFDIAEVKEIPAAYNITRLYEALSNAAYTLTAKPRSIRVMRRGGRLFLWREKAWEARSYERR